MKTFDNLSDFAALFDSANVRAQLKQMSSRPDIKALVAYRHQIGTLSAMAYTDIPEVWPDSVEYVWMKPSTSHSRTQHALALVGKGLSVKDAATQANVTTVAIYRAIKRRQNKPVCKCCGQVIREAFRTPLPPEGDA